MKRKNYEHDSQARILVVDTDRKTAQTIQAVLEEQGYKVETASSGKEAVGKALGFAPDLLVTDVCLGAMNGVEAATRITAKLPGCSVLFLSSFTSISEVLNSAPERLVYSSTSKPLHALDLLNAIAYMLPTASLYNDAASAVGHYPNPRDYIGQMAVEADTRLRLQ